MGKLTAPLLSFGADGQVGKSLVFSRWRGINYARRYVVPSNPQTAAQQTTRNTFSMLSDLWARYPADAREPWSIEALGKSYLDFNRFIGRNLTVLRGDPNMNGFLASLGARAGISLTSLVAAATANPDEISCTVVAPTPPTGWTLDGYRAVAFIDQDPALPFLSPVTVFDEVPAASPFTFVVAAGTGGVAHQCSVYPIFTRPDALEAFGPSLNDQVTPV